MNPIVLVCILLVGAWFLIGEKSFGDKLLLLGIMVGIYIVYALLNGASLNDIFVPLREFFNSRNPTKI